MRNTMLSKIFLLSLSVLASTGLYADGNANTYKPISVGNIALPANANNIIASQGTDTFSARFTKYGPTKVTLAMPVQRICNPYLYRMKAVVSLANTGTSDVKHSACYIHSIKLDMTHASQPQQVTYNSKPAYQITFPASVINEGKWHTGIIHTHHHCGLSDKYDATNLTVNYTLYCVLKLKMAAGA